MDKAAMKDGDKMMCGKMCGMKQAGAKNDTKDGKSGMCSGCSESCSCCSDMKGMDGKKG